MFLFLWEENNFTNSEMEMIVHSIQLAGANLDFKAIMYGVFLLHVPSALAARSLQRCGSASLWVAESPYSCLSPFPFVLVRETKPETQNQ